MKSKLYAIAILLFLTTNSFSEIVKQIDIRGNERVNSETIKIFGGFDIGQDLDSSNLNDILKKLYETNFFKDVNLSLENSVLKIIVVENPIIQNLVIKGVENKTLKEKIEETIILKEKNPFVEDEIQYGINNIKNLLQEVGFYFSSVELLKKENSNNTIDLVFNIDLGKKAFINEIFFIRIKNIKKKTFKYYIRGR